MSRGVTTTCHLTNLHLVWYRLYIFRQQLFVDNEDFLKQEEKQVRENQKGCLVSRLFRLLTFCHLVVCGYDGKQFHNANLIIPFDATRCQQYLMSSILQCNNKLDILYLPKSIRISAEKPVYVHTHESISYQYKSRHLYINASGASTQIDTDLTLFNLYLAKWQRDIVAS